MATREPYRGTRKEMSRAIRRLNVLEWVMLGAAAIAALVGGWLIAWLARDLGMSFRLTWTLASVLLFVVPGLIVLAREAGGWSRIAIIAEPDPVGGAASEGGTEPGGQDETYGEEER